MDRSLQLMYAYEQDVGLDKSIYKEFVARRRQISIDICELLVQLNLPSMQLKIHIKEMAPPEKERKSLKKLKTMITANQDKEEESPSKGAKKGKADGGRRETVPESQKAYRQGMALLTEQ